MLGKLMKHELKGTYKTFLLMYAVLFLLSMTTFVGLQIESKWLITLSLGILVFSMFALGIVYCMMIFGRYYKNLYSNEGYLMFTLPVRGWELLVSKLVIALFWEIVTGLVGILCSGIILSSMPEMLSHGEILELIREGIYYVGWDSILLFIGISVIGSLEGIVEIYFLISIAHLPFIHKGKIIFALVVAYLSSKIQNFLFVQLAPGSLKEGMNGFMEISNPSLEQIKYAFQAGGMYVLLFTLLFLVIYFVAEIYFLSKQVSLK